MGANIGTTVTSWIVSMSEWGEVLKPEFFAPVLFGAGAFITLFAKSHKKKEGAEILIGFALLFIGLSFMSGAIKPYRDAPIFSEAFRVLGQNPILGILTGLVVTAVIQSSSASVGILQTLAINGMVNWQSAIFITLGQNIGTCVTALLSAIGASKNAKRAAMVHLYFNVIGTAVFMILFYSVNYFAHFAFLADAANGAGIAVVHSLFNVFATMVLLPFSKGLEKLAYLTIREESQGDQEEEKDELLVLDSRFLDQPAFAIEQSVHAAVQMAEESKKTLFTAMELIGNYTEEKAQKVLELESLVDRYEDELASFTR